MTTHQIETLARLRSRGLYPETFPSDDPQGLRVTFGSADDVNTYDGWISPMGELVDVHKR